MDYKLFCVLQHHSWHNRLTSKACLPRAARVSGPPTTGPRTLLQPRKISATHIPRTKVWGSANLTRDYVKWWCSNKCCWTC